MECRETFLANARLSSHWPSVPRINGNVSVPQYFDMQSGCQFEWTPQQMADHCLSTVPNPTESEGVRKLLSVRRLGSAEARCDVHMTYLSGDGDDNGYHVPQE